MTGLCWRPDLYGKGTLATSWNVCRKLTYPEATAVTLGSDDRDVLRSQVQKLNQETDVGISRNLPEVNASRLQQEPFAA